MTTVRIEAQMTSDNLLEAVRQLSVPELDRFVHDVIVLQAKARSPSVSRTEAELLKVINQGLPAEVERRYARLAEARDTETLSPEEHADLLRLTHLIEQATAKRAEALTELARLRGVALPQLIDDLSIRTPMYA
jgi:hypothetical protein